MEGNRRVLSTHGSINLLSVVIILIVVVVVAAVLFPVFVRTGNHSSMSSCQSNMKQIGNAFKMYLADYNDHYPTNRAYVGGHKLGPITECVQLSDSEIARGQTAPPRFQHGLNWAEELSPYDEQGMRSSDPASIWRCPYASKRTFPEGSTTAATTYVFNRNLVEKSEGVVLSAANLMMVRETDRVLNAELRPTNESVWTSRKPPISPFLSTEDCRLGRTNPKLHANGSNMLVADGHVKYHDATYYPVQKDITKSKCWDPKTRQWYNFFWSNPKTSDQTIKNMSIAITP